MTDSICATFVFDICSMEAMTARSRPDTATDGRNGAEPEKNTPETETGENGANTEPKKVSEEAGAYIGVDMAAGDGYQTPHPEGITSLCYSCTEYETCNVKTGTCTKCDQYKNRTEAHKTDEQRYSDEQDRIDRETAKKLREQADEERMNNIPSAFGENGQKVHQIRLGASFFEDACSNRKSFELRKNDRGYKEGDILELMEFADGRNTGRMVRKLVTYILEDYTGLEDGFCIMATSLVNEILPRIYDDFRLTAALRCNPYPDISCPERFCVVKYCF